jgi:hypothetical protein
LRRPAAIKATLCALLALAPGAARAQVPPQPLPTGRCSLDLPLDAGKGFDAQRFLVLGYRTYRFALDASTRMPTWRLLGRTQEGGASITSGLLRSRRKWRDGALWSMEGRRLSRWDPALRRWELQAAGAQSWARTLAPVAAATLQAGYEAVQLQEFTLLFNPLARRLFIFRPLEDRIREVRLGLPPRTYQDLARKEPLEDLCWQVLPKGPAEAWVIQKRSDPAGLYALPLELYEGTAGEAVPLPGLHLPLFPDPTGRLRGLEEALASYAPGDSPLPATGGGPTRQ